MANEGLSWTLLWPDTDPCVLYLYFNLQPWRRNRPVSHWAWRWLAIIWIHYPQEKNFPSGPMNSAQRAQMVPQQAHSHTFLPHTYNSKGWIFPLYILFFVSTKVSPVFYKTFYIDSQNKKIKKNPKTFPRSIRSIFFFNLTRKKIFLGLTWRRRDQRISNHGSIPRCEDIGGFSKWHPHICDVLT